MKQPNANTNTLVVGMTRGRRATEAAAATTTRRVHSRGLMSPLPLLWLTAAVLLLRIPSHGGFVSAHPPPPQANDIFGTVYGCSSALIEMDDNQDGMIKKGEYLDFVNLLADFLCLPPRPIMDLEIQTVFFSIACLCQEREGFGMDCCFGNDAAIYTKGAADAVTRTEDEDSYLRAACLLTQAILGPQQCALEPRTLSPGAVTVDIARLRSTTGDDGLSDTALAWIIAGAILLALLCCVLLFCACIRKKDEEEEEEEIIVKEELLVEEVKSIPADEEPSVSPTPIDTEEEVPSVPPPGHVQYEPKSPPPAAPVIVPAPILRSVPPADEDSVEENENTGRKTGATIDDDEDEEYGRKFGGQGELPQPSEPEGVRLRHIEVEKGTPDEYEYPEREFSEYKLTREDSGQILPHEEIDSGVHIPTRPVKPPVVFNHPKYQRPEKPEPEPFDARKMRRQMALGDGEVWDALAAHEEQREGSKSSHGCMLYVLLF